MNQIDATQPNVANVSPSTASEATPAVEIIASLSSNENELNMEKPSFPEGFLKLLGIHDILCQIIY